jgi:hypothetical protein
MRTRVLALALLAVSCAPSRLHDAVDFGAILSAVALNGAAGTRTATLTLDKRFTRCTVVDDYTYSAATSVTITPTVSIDGGTTYGNITSESISSGAAEQSSYVVTETGTASWTQRHSYDVEGCDKLKLVYAGGGTPGAGDLITAKAVCSLVTQ